MHNYNQVGLALQLSALWFLEIRIRPLLNFGRTVWANNWPKPYVRKAVEFPKTIKLKVVEQVQLDYAQLFVGGFWINDTTKNSPEK